MDENVKNSSYDFPVVLIETDLLHSTGSLPKSNVMQNMIKWLSIEIK